MSNLTKEECLKVFDDIKFLGSINIPLSSLDLIEKLINEHFDNQLNVEEIEFLLMSEEERFNTFGQMYAYELYVSSKEKLEIQKEMLKE